MAARSLFSPWTLFCLLSLFVTAASGQKPDVTATSLFIVGSEKTILCYVTTTQTNINGLFPLVWTRESNPGAPMQATESTSVVTGTNFRSYTSTVRFTVTKEMNKELFICTASLGNTVETGTWRVYVHKQPDLPAITGPTQIFSDVNSSWTCRVTGATSAPNVYWQFGNGSRILSGVTDLGTTISADPDKAGYVNSDAVLNFYNVSRGLRLNVGPGSPSFLLSCLAVHYDTQTQKASDINVEVYYAPQVTGNANYTVTVGAQAVINCRVTATPAVTSVSWYKDNNLLSTGALRYSGGTTSNPSLTILSVEREDAGKYVCTASNSIGSGSTGDSYVTVRYVPVIMFNSSTFGGNLGEDVVIPCPIDSEPLYTTVFWYKVSSLTGSKTPIIVANEPSKYSGGTQATPSLTIKGLTSLDAGLYRCAADNAVGRGEGPDISVQVFFKPEITVQPQLEGNASNTLVIPCNVNALPAITSLTWYQGQQLLNTSDTTRYSGGTVVSTSLTILKLAPKDAGNYYCVATNSKGTTFSGTTVLTVNYKPIITGPSEVGSKALNNVTLDVSIAAYPNATNIRWRKRGTLPNSYTNIDVTGSKYGGGILGSPGLQIRNLATTDVGVYVVEVTNAYGITTYDVTVAVSYAPTAANITSLESAYKEGETIQLTCSANGFPSPLYRWFRNNVLYVPQGQSQGATFTDVATPANNATFKCEAYNTEGSASTTASVVVRYKPRPGSTLTNITATIGQTVTLVCAVDSNPQPDSYTWTWNNQTLYSGNRSTISVTVFNSTYMGAYQCTATNSIGTASPSITVYITEAPNTTTPRIGQSTTDSSGLSTATLVLIIIVCIIILVVLILIIVYCCSNRKCKRKDNNVEPTRPAVVPAPHYAQKTEPMTNGFHDNRLPSTKTQNGRIDVTEDGTKPLSGTANGSVAPSITRLGHGMSISVPGGQTPRPHHLPPLGQDGAAQEQEPAQDDKKEKKKKRRRKRQDEGGVSSNQGTPQHNVNGNA